MKRHSLAILLALSGCSTWHPTISRATLVVRPEVLTGGFCAQTTINPYTQASINHLLLKLYTYDGSEHDTGIAKSLLNAQLDNPVMFANLKNNTTYRIKAYAYNASTEDATTLISTPDENSYVDIPVGTDDRPSITTLKVKLIDRLFNGQSSSSLSIISGGYSAVASETIRSPWVVTTIVGSGNGGTADGIGTSATISYPQGLAIDASGNLFFADYGNSRIRKLSPFGGVTTFAGNSAGFVDGTGTAALFRAARTLCIDPNNNLYVADRDNCAIRKVTPAGVVSTFAGSYGTGYVDASGTQAKFNNPRGVALDSNGNVFVGDTENNVIRKISSTGVVTTFAGNGGTGLIDGPASTARFNYPFGLAFDSSNNLYVADFNNNVIRKITPAGMVSTLAGNGSAGLVDGTGTAAGFNKPTYLTLDSAGNVYVAGYADGCIRQITPNGIVTTLAGNGTVGYADGTGTNAIFSSPTGITIDQYGNLYIGDQGNNRIRKMQR